MKNKKRVNEIFGLSLIILGIFLLNYNLRKEVNLFYSLLSAVLILIGSMLLWKHIGNLPPKGGWIKNSKKKF